MTVLTEKEKIRNDLIRKGAHFLWKHAQHTLWCNQTNEKFWEALQKVNKYFATVKINHLWVFSWTVDMIQSTEEADKYRKTNITEQTEWCKNIWTRQAILIKWLIMFSMGVEALAAFVVEHLAWPQDHATALLVLVGDQVQCQNKAAELRTCKHHQLKKYTFIGDVRK